MVKQSVKGTKTETTQKLVKPVVEKKRVVADKKVGYQIGISAKDLLDAGSHFGHGVAKTHPNITPFLYQSRQGVQIFDLIQTSQKLQEAASFLFEAAKEGKTIAVLGTKRQAREVILREAERLGIPYIINRWVGGTGSNWDQIRKSLKAMRDLEKELEGGVGTGSVKKEKVQMKRKLARMERLFGGLKKLDKLFDILIVIDIRQENVAVKEALVSGVKTVAIVDSNSDPELINFPIPANDDAVKSITIIFEELAKAVEAGQKLAQSTAVKG